MVTWCLAVQMMTLGLAAGPGASDCGLEDAGCARAPEAKCAKRTQFSPAAGGSRRKSCKTKPNLGGLGYVDKGSCRVGRGSAGE